MREKLKPCPFCGSDAKLDFTSVTESMAAPPHQSGGVDCTNKKCEAEIWLEFNPDDAEFNPTDELTKRWNARAPIVQ